MTDQIVGKVMLVRALLVRNLTPIGQVVVEYAKLIWESISDCMLWLMEAIPRWYEDISTCFNAFLWVPRQIFKFYALLMKPVQEGLEQMFYSVQRWNQEFSVWYREVLHPVIESILLSVYPHMAKPFKERLEKTRQFQREKLTALWSLKDISFQLTNGKEITLEQCVALVIILAAQIIILEKCYGAVGKLMVSMFKEDKDTWQRIKWYLVFASIVMFVFGSSSQM